ncbi:MAG TPA: twin-arginine translocase TatA/TatE family subunit [Puia sp.]|uniref:Sec-independent protein translocase subunit TatA/TatB n=1 Tax=Puia sp. TaxID=2045100 RepID=UPI002B7C9736|nr:twin-arginine translocase TatA/TatE family subunit [Puia sp.]HVU99176.1 twin-arginine translocase TatA/TatE family subunit [Puia sp.]
MTTFLISMPGGSEWVLIILAVLVLFGGRKIPEFMRGLGKGIREFNDAKNNVKKELEEGMNEPNRPANSAPANSAPSTPSQN